MGQKIKYIAKRESADELTVGIMQCELNDQVNTREKFLANLKAAIADWISKTEEGRRAWNDSVEDFNFGDLAMHSEDFKLRMAMNEFGIRDFEMQVISEEQVDFTYDTVIGERVFNEHEIKEFLEKFATESKDGDNVELMMDDHTHIIYKGKGYYIPENNSLYSVQDEEMVEYLNEKFKEA